MVHGSFSRTDAEQSVFRAIEALKQELSIASEEERKKEILNQISELTEQLEFLSMPDSETLMKKNKELSEKVKELEKKIRELKEKEMLVSKGQRSLVETKNPEESLFLLYHVLLEKYSEIINDFEKKTVGELKALVNPDDLTVQGLTNQFKLDGYFFERDYLVTARRAFEFIQNEIEFVKSKIGINFWLTPTEMMKNKIGDDEDQAVLLCSILSGLGDKNAEVVIAEMDDLGSHAFVITEYHGKFVLMDSTQNQHFNEFIGEKMDVLKKYSFKGTKIKKFLYRFNKDKYEQFV
ncbi:MAG: hypothetical protein ABIA76_01080 [Candidatus Diapherotrites archaeon]